MTSPAFSNCAITGNSVSSNGCVIGTGLGTQLLAHQVHEPKCFLASGFAYVLCSPLLSPTGSASMFLLILGKFDKYKNLYSFTPNSFAVVENMFVHTEIFSLPTKKTHD